MTRQTVSSGTVWEDEVGYSRAVRVGDSIEVSGTTATDEDRDIVGVGDPNAQATEAIANIEALVDPDMLVEIEAAAVVDE